jgi:hypothetical protein
MACAMHYLDARTVGGWVLVYAASLALSLRAAQRSTTLTATSVCVLGALFICALQLRTASTSSLGLLFACGYFGQDFFHYITAEPTFQSSYQGKESTWVLTLLSHTFYLLPLTIDALWHTRRSVATLVAERDMRVHTTLTGALEAPMHSIGPWLPVALPSAVVVRAWRKAWWMR